MSFQHRQEDAIKVTTAVIEPELALFEMEQKLILTKAVEFLHSAFGERPEALDPVYVPGFICKFIHMVVDAKMFLKTEIDKTVITPPSIRVDDHVEPHFAAYNGEQSAFLAVRDDLRVNPPVALENAEHDRFAAGPAPALAGDSAAAKIRFVDLDHPGLERCVPFAFGKQPGPYFLEYRVHAFPRHAGQLARLCRGKIHRKITDYLAKFLLRDSGTAIIPVNLLHVSSLAPI